MGGKNKAVEKQDQITDAQREASRLTAAQSDEDRKRRDVLLKPAVDYNTSFASGDKNALTQAIAPLITDLDRGAAATRESVYESTTPGAGRDIALAMIDRDKRTTIAQAKNSAYTGSFDKLASIGSGYGSFSLNELGASLRSMEGASGSNAISVKAESERKAATMGFLGEIVGAGGKFATGKWA